MDLESACQLTSQLGKMEMKELGVSEFEKDVAVTRFYNVLSKIEEEADKWENWDTSLFVLGFLGSLIVTLGTALSLTNFVSQSAISTISTIVLLVSSVATAVLGIRERLKFRERALQARRTATRLQHMAVAFMTSTGEFAMPGMEVGRKRYIAFMNELEAAKAVGDADRLQMRASKDDVAGGASGTTQAQRVANPNRRDSESDRDRRDAPADPGPDNPVKKSEALQVAAATQPEAARVLLPSSLAQSAAASVPGQVRTATGTTMRPGPGSSAGGPASTGSESQTRTGSDYTMTLARPGFPPIPGPYRTLGTLPVGPP